MTEAGRRVPEWITNTRSLLNRLGIGDRFDGAEANADDTAGMTT